MAILLINDKISAKGSFSLSRIPDVRIDKKTGEEIPFLKVEGILALVRYIEEIKSLETPRYYLSGIEVCKEDFGSDDEKIYYHFIANTFFIKDNKIRDEKTIRKLENKYFSVDTLKGDDNND